jgi:hypothetical protein
MKMSTSALFQRKFAWDSNMHEFFRKKPPMICLWN